MSLTIQRYIANYTNKLQHDHDEKMALLSPTHQKLFEDTKAMIVYIAKYYRSFLEIFYFRPSDMVNQIPFHRGMTDEYLDAKVIELLKKSRNYNLIPFYKVLRKSHSVFYSFYFTISPPYRPASIAYVEHDSYPFIGDVPLIHKKIQGKVDEIKSEIRLIITSREFEELEFSLDDNKYTFAEKKDLLIEYWLTISVNLRNKQYGELIQSFNDIWNKNE